MKNWYDIFPKGTKEGEIEEKIFKSLTRDKKWKFRSVTGMSKELKIKEVVVEKIILKYAKLGLLVQNPQNDLQWGYWETCDIKKKKNFSLVEYDYKMRLKNTIVEHLDDEDDEDDDDEENNWEDID